MQRSGQDTQADFFDNTGGLNLSDTVFRVKDGQAVDGYNFILAQTGGILKRLGPTAINTVASTAVQTLGFGLFNPVSGNKVVIRAADSVLQNVDTQTPSFTTLTQDNTAVTTTVFTTSQNVVSNQFNTTAADTLWFAGGGANNIYGAYSGTKFTKNGSALPTGSFSATRVALGSGAWTTTGTFTYAVAYHKLSTGVLSNVALDVSATVTALTDKVTIDLTGLSNLDTTTTDKVYLYRSTVGGGSAFTTGDLVAQITSGVTTYDDTGTSLSSSQNVPRAGNQNLDNSRLSDGTYNCITTWKRKLVVAKGSTIYVSDVNKPESWPTVNQITVPSGGPITALATIAFISPQAQTLDELMVIFKEREIWIINGDTANNGNGGDWILKFIDSTGCASQSLIAYGNGYIGWIDYRGVYLWNGTGKPYYISKSLEPLFARDGDINKIYLNRAVGQFFRKENCMVWYLSHKLYGIQKYALRLDLRLTLPSITQDLTGNIVPAVFTQDTYAMPIYGALSYLPTSNGDELMILGDGSGYVYFADNGFADGSSDYSFSYKTRPLDMGNPNTKKLFKQVIVWVKALGDWNLTLDYWAGFNGTESTKNTKALPISTQPTQGGSLYDVAFYDIASYDDVPQGNLTPLVFNLEPGSNNGNRGTALQLQFRNDTQSQPIEIHGFSVIYNEMERIIA